MKLSLLRNTEITIIYYQNHTSVCSPGDHFYPEISIYFRKKTYQKANLKRLLWLKRICWIWHPQHQQQRQPFRLRLKPNLHWKQGNLAPTKKPNVSKPKIIKSAASPKTKKAASPKNNKLNFIQKSLMESNCMNMMINQNVWWLYG